MNEPTPRGFKAAGKRLWQHTTKNFELRQDELETLRAACSEADLIARLEKSLEDQELLMRGSMGQPVINPIVSELRQHRSTMATLLRGLKLPDEEQGAPVNQQRDAAQSKWAAAHGKSA